MTLTPEEMNRILGAIEEIVEKFFVNKAIDHANFEIQQRLEGYVLIRKENMNFTRDKSVCCITMRAFQSGYGRNGMAPRTIQDLSEYLGYPVNYCPFCGAKF